MEEAQRLEIAERITELRERSPFTQPQVAAKLGIGLRAYQKLEDRGTTKFERCQELAAIHAEWMATDLLRAAPPPPPDCDETGRGCPLERPAPGKVASQPDRPTKGARTMRRFAPLAALTLALAGCGNTTANDTSGSTIIETAPPDTVTVTQTVSAPPLTATKKFTGNGGKTLPPFSLDGDATLRWTNTGGDFFAIYATSETGDGDVNSSASSGDTFLAAGSYKLEVNALGDWTITIQPAP